ncbi:MAG: organic solvent tolerance protein OstA [Pirellulales bacterium]
MPVLCFLIAGTGGASGTLAQEPPTPPVARLPQVDLAVQPAQFAPPPSPYPTTVPAPAATLPQRASFRRVQIFPRAEGLGPQAEWLTTPQGENALVISGGVNVVVQGLSVEGLPDMFGALGDIDIETDRAVIWTAGVNTANPADLTQAGDLPLEIYMEGNIVFRQGDRIVYADRMFYDVRRQIGIILGAELLTPLPLIDSYQYPGLVRLRAAALRQLDQSRFVAQDALVTTSRIEEPSYHFAAETLTFQDIPRPVVDPLTGAPAVDPVTGQPVVDHEQLAQSESNFLYVAGVPVFYWPTLATDLEKPSYYIDNVRIRNDSIFGTQLLLEFDAFQLLGIDAPEGVEWDLNLDYLSERGLGFGTGAQYARDTFFNLVGPTTGRADAWFINDNGVDNLGLGRRELVPEEELRGRVFWNHRQHLIGGLLDDWTVQAEVGWISDRNFLEQFYESEWDENKDQLTGVRLKRTYDNQAFSVEANAQVNEFFTQTQWLPRLDHYWLGEPLVDDQLTWFEHSSAAFADIGVATTATNTPFWSLLPWEVDGAGARITGEGERLVTRQEIDWPIDVAPFKVVPFALGELAHWGQDINGNDLQRAYAHTGVRASIPFWHADPTIRDPIFNLNGLAHKVVFEVEASYADATRDMTQLPLYDELEDDTHEEFRRRLFFPPFGGGLLPYYMAGPTIDPKFDPRFYALRSGLQGWVTSPSTEIADDLALVRFGMRHRLQTKRGAPGEERIIDWLTFQTNSTWFPVEDRDNFGAPLGLFDYDLRWHLGDRFSILSDGAADTFGDGLRTASIGMLLNRPARGNFYLGFRTLSGPFEAHVLTAAINYRMSAKWIGSASASVDFGDAGNIGQSVAFSRIGESLIATVGGHVDESKDNVGVSFLLEPRFLPTLSATRKTGIEVPPAGAFGLE